MFKNPMGYVFAGVAILLAVLFYWFNSSEDFSDIQTENKGIPSAAPSIPSKLTHLSAWVDPHFTVASIQRLGINIPDESTYSIRMLKSINPSYLRHAQGQLENIFENQRAHVDNSHVSLSDFLNLCSQVGANPWIVISTPIHDGELDAFGLFLEKQADTSRFSNLRIEFEKGFLRSHPHPQENVTDIAFERISAAAGPHVHLTHEVGTHEGTAASEEKAAFIEGTISGLALAKSVIQKIQANIQPLMVSNLVQYDNELINTTGITNVWDQPWDPNNKQWRPAGLAVIMLNQILGGSLHNITLQKPLKGSLSPEANHLTMAAFRTGNQWTSAIISTYENPIVLSIQFPDDELALPDSKNVLQYTSSDFETSEEAEHVKIVDQPIETNQRTLTFRVPAYSMVFLKNKA
jgi:hypothetical protein